MTKTLSRLLGIAVLLAGIPSGASAGHDDIVTAQVCSAGRAGQHPAGRDNDSDGVPDSEDWCVNSNAGGPVGSNGCASGEIPASCRKAAVPVPVAARPAAAAPARNTDGDGDGVQDADDRCPGTAAGAAVDRKGCVLIEQVVLKGVSFGSGSAVLQPAASDTLRGVAAAMKADSRLKVEIGGHTDSVGLAAKNKALSERRAQAVKKFLVKEGVAAERLDAVGYGADQPVDSNDTPAGRANNRRVEFKVARS